MTMSFSKYIKLANAQVSRINILDFLIETLIFLKTLKHLNIQ